MTSTHTAAETTAPVWRSFRSDNFVETYEKVLTQKGGFTGQITGLNMVLNSLILGIGFAVGKIVLSRRRPMRSSISASAFTTLAFWIIFTTLLLPLEVRIMPSYEVMSKLGLLNSYTA